MSYALCEEVLKEIRWKDATTTNHRHCLYGGEFLNDSFSVKPRAVQKKAKCHPAEIVWRG